MADQLLSLEEVAERLHVPVATARYWRHCGRLPFLFKLGRRVVGYESELHAWIREERAAQNGGSAA